MLAVRASTEDNRGLISSRIESPALAATLTAPTMPRAPRALDGYRPYWAKRFGVAKFLPMSRIEMEQLGWDSYDIVLVDAA